MTREEWDAMTPDEQWAFVSRNITISIPFHKWGYGESWHPSQDDQENPCPSYIYGEMILVWYEGSWQIDYSAYMKRRQEKGEVDRWGKELK